MPTDEERREVAARLREQLRYMRKNNCYAEDADVVECGNSAYRNIAWSVEPYGNFEKGNYVHIVERLADLIESQERTCHDLRRGSSFFLCSECGAFLEDGAVTNASHFIPPRYCPNCGARIVEASDDEA